MTLDEVLETITSSVRGDWWHEACWGARSAPSYHDQFCDEESENLLKVNSHSDIAVYKPNVSITLAYGLQCTDDFKGPWTKKFPNRDASSSYVDVFYNNALVFRDAYVNVDGARARLPLPTTKWDKQKTNIKALTVPERLYRFIRLVDSMDHLSDYDSYFQQAGFTIVDEEWPREQ